MKILTEQEKIFLMNNYNNYTREELLTFLNIKSQKSLRKILESLNLKKDRSKKRSKSPSGFIRNCPICGKERKYKFLSSYKKDIEKNLKCQRCSTKESHNREEVKKILSDSQKGRFEGEKNPMFGKKHDADTRNKISGNTKKFIEEYPNKSKPMKGKTLKDIWINKYGNEIAEGMEKERRIKLSASLRGSKNPMYGKTCPSGSGRGVKGWYKTYFFRSLMELSYIMMLERFCINFVSAERSDLKIKYISIDGNERTYVADFLVEGKYLVECKPKGLINNKEVKIKALAAKNFCESRGLKYKITTPSKLPQNLLDSLISSGSVILPNR